MDAKKKLEKAIHLAQRSHFEPAYGPPQLINEYGYAPRFKYPASIHSNPRASIFEAMGVKVGRGEVITKSAKGVVEVDGINFTLREHAPHKSGRKSSKHRLFAECPMCSKQIPLGRMSQHASVHEGESLFRPLPSGGTLTLKRPVPRSR